MRGAGSISARPAHLNLERISGTASDNQSALISPLPVGELDATRSARRALVAARGCLSAPGGGGLWRLKDEPERRQI